VTVFFRVERGRPTEEELAVLTVLLAVPGPGAEEEQPTRPTAADWRLPGHRVTRSWRAGTAAGAPGVGGTRGVGR